MYERKRVRLFISECKETKSHFKPKVLCSKIDRIVILLSSMFVKEIGHVCVGVWVWSMQSMKRDFAIYRRIVFCWWRCLYCIMANRERTTVNERSRERRSKRDVKQVVSVQLNIIVNNCNRVKGPTVIILNGGWCDMNVDARSYINQMLELAETQIS